MGIASRNLELLAYRLQTAAGSGTQNATVGTEHTLQDVSSAGVFMLSVDLVNMAAGDLLELRMYQIILTGGTRRVVQLTSYINAQAPDDVIALLGPLGNELGDSGSLRFTLKQVRGTSGATGRAFPWKVLQG